MKRTNQIVLFNILSTVLVNGIAFFTAPVFTRLLGAENYGIVAICMTWIGIAVSVFGLETDGSLSPAKVRFGDEEQNGFRSSILFLSIVSFAAASGIVLILIWPLSKILKLNAALILIILIQAFAQFCVKMQNAIYVIDFKARENFILAMFISVGSTVASIILIGQFEPDKNYYGRMLGLAGTYLVVGVFICFRTLTSGKVLYHKTYWKYCLRISVPYIFHSLAGNILGQSDRVMIQWIVDEASVGIYSLAATFGGIINTIMYAFSRSWVPFFYNDLKEKKYDMVKIRAENSIELFSVISMGFVLLTPEVFDIIADNTFFAGCKYIPLFVLGYYMDFLYLFPANYEMYHGRSDIVAKATTFAAAVNIILNFILIIFLGTLGAVVATAFSHFILFVFHYISAKRLENGYFPFYKKQFVLPGIVVCMICLLCFFINDRLFLLRWGLGGLIGLFELYRIYQRKTIF